MSGGTAKANETPARDVRRIDGRRAAAAERQGRKQLFDRIEPSLVSVQMSAPSGTPSTATRPPVIGRELPLDPERTQRYSSSDGQLEAYLAALRQKTVALKTPEASSDLQQSSPTVSRFMKKAPSDVQAPVLKAGKTTLSTTAQPLSKASSVLQRAQMLTGKLTVVKTTTTTKEPSPSPDEPELIEPIDAKESSNSEAVSRDASSSIGSFMNIKDIEDLLSDVQSEHRPVRKDGSSSLKHSIKHESTEISNDVTDLIEESLHQKTDTSEVMTEKDVSQVASLVSSSSDKQVTLGPGHSYSDDFEEESNEPSLVTSSSERISVRSNSRDAERIEATVSKPSKPQMASKEVQTMPQFVLGLQDDPVRLPVHPIRNVSLASFVDPQRISSYVVTNETLRTMSSYSPSMLALDELMRQQLRTTRSFVEAQRRMYVSVVDSLKPDHKYTTWTDTQRLISNRRNRRKAVT